MTSHERAIEVGWHREPTADGTPKWYAEMGGVRVAEAVMTGRSGVDNYPWDWSLTNAGEGLKRGQGRTGGVADTLRSVKDKVLNLLTQEPVSEMAVEARPAPVPPKAVGSGRRHDVPGCPRCDAADTVFHPAHDASSRCDSGGREHCSCEVCF